jgi:hypothetical protein
MANRHGKDTKVILGKYDLSAYLNEATPSMSLETAETSTFGASAKTYIMGQNDGTVSFKGLFDGDATAISAIFEDVINNDLTPPFTLAYDGGFAFTGSPNVYGRSCTIGLGKQTSYEISAPVSDVVSLSGDFQVTGGLRQGVIVAGGRAITTTPDNTGGVDGTAASTLGYTANLHVTANTRSTSTTIKLQHSTDNSTWVDLATFTAVSASTITSEQLTGSGTVNRYLRANTVLTAGTGSITITLSAARRN